MVRAVTGASDTKALLAQAKAVQEGLKRSLKQDVGPEVEKRYKRSAVDWTRQPRFKSELKDKGKSARKLTLHVFPDAKGEGPTPEWTFHWTDKGTEEHPITARRVPRLFFRGGYKPKTRYRAKTGGPGIATGKVYRPVSVEHPGTEAREFSAKLLEDYETEYLRTLKNATKRAARESRR